MTAFFEVCLENVRFFARHGVFEHERIDGNEFIVNLKVKYPAPDLKQIEKDSLDHTISYADLFQIVKEEMDSPKNLLETVASAIISRIKNCYPQASEIYCHITKTTPPIAGFNGSASASLLVSY